MAPNPTKTNPAAGTVGGSVGPPKAPPDAPGADPLAAERLEVRPSPNGVAAKRLSRRYRTSLEGWIIVLLGAIAYTIVGELAISDGHVVVFEAVDRLSRAYMVWWNEPAKLAAIGLTLTPIPTLVALPLTLIKPLATSLAGMPVLSAIPAGGALAMLNATLARCELSRELRYPALLLFAINPLFVYYASNGTGIALSVFLVMATLLALVSWQINRSTRYLVGAGMAMAFAGLTYYPLIVWGAALVLVIVALRAHDKVDGAKLESAAIVYLTPFVYAIMVWVLLNAIILDSPFGWLSGNNAYSAINAPESLGQAGISLSAALTDLLELIGGAAPIALVAVPALLLTGFADRKSRFAPWMALLITVLALLIAADARLYDRADLLSLDTALYVAAAGTVGAAWIYRAAEDWRAITALGLLAMLALTLPLSWNAMKTYPHQDQEQAFTRFIATGESQEGTTSRGGYEVGIDPELEMAEAINEIAGDRTNLILTDNAQTYAVILFTGRPGLFVDRIDEGDEEWKAARDNLPRGIEYVLVATKAPADEIARRYPDIVRDGDNHFLPVVSNKRYLLARIVVRNGKTSPEVGGEGVRGPNLVTPPTPAAPSDEPVEVPGVSSPGGSAESEGGSGTGSGSNAGSAPESQTSAPTIEGQ